MSATSRRSPEAAAVPRLALTPFEAASSLGVTLEFFERHVLPAVQVVAAGNKQLVPTAELQRWLRVEPGEPVLTLEEAADRMQADRAARDPCRAPGREPTQPTRRVAHLRIRSPGVDGSPRNDAQAERASAFCGTSRAVPPAATWPAICAGIDRTTDPVRSARPPEPKTPRGVEPRLRRAPDGGWIWRYRVRWKDPATGRRTVEELDTIKQALDFLAHLRLARRRVGLGDLDRGAETLSDFVAEWWETYAKANLAKSTRKTYATLWNRHGLGRVGHLELRHVTPAVVARFRHDLEADRVGVEAIRKLMTMLQAVFRETLSGTGCRLPPATRYNSSGSRTRDAGSQSWLSRRPRSRHCATPSVWRRRQHAADQAPRLRGLAP